MNDGNNSKFDISDTIVRGENGLRGPIVKDARAQRSGVAFRKSLLHLLKSKPFDQISVREICAEAGVHYATFFRHYASKEALLDTIASEQIIASVKLTLPLRDAGDERGSLEALCAYVEENRGLWSVLFNGGAGATMRAEWLRAARIVAETRPSVNSWLPKELGTIYATTLIAETLAWWLAQDEGAYSSAEIAAILERLVSLATVARA